MRKVKSFALLLLLSCLFLSMLAALPPALAWWNENWTKRITIAFDNTASTENLVNFPVLVHLTSSDINWSNVQDDLDDLRFLDPDGTQLDAELESYTTNDEAWIWVEVPQIDLGSSTDYIWLYYDNTGASSGWDAEGTWDSNFKMVQHMDDLTTSTTEDSTSNNNDGTKTGANEPIVTSGKMNDAQDFDGSNDGINCGHDSSLDITSAITIEMWMKPDGAQENWDRLLEKKYDTSYAFGVWASGVLFFEGLIGGVQQNFQSTPTFTVDVWNYVAVTYNSSTGYFYVGTASSSFTPSPAGALGSEAARDVKLGIHAVGATNLFNGIIDEVRVSNSVRSADWLEAQFLSMTENFITFGSEQEVNVIVLNSPADDLVSYELTFDFKYTPSFSDTIENSSLWTSKGGWSRKHWNTSAVTNYAENTITETFPVDGDYDWNIEVFDTLGSSWFAAANRTLYIREPVGGGGMNALMLVGIGLVFVFPVLFIFRRRRR